VHFAWLFVTAWKVRYMALFGNAVKPATGEIMEGDKQHIIDPDTPSPSDITKETLLLHQLCRDFESFSWSWMPKLIT
jgi:hypothetical protein